MRTVLFILLWSAALLGCYFWAVRFESTPGVAASCAERFPTGTSLTLDGERPTLVCFAHPHCPCTRATLAELDRLVARCDGRLDVRVLFYSDPALGADWERSDLWKKAERIPGVSVSSDPLGATAARFGVTTSGDALLYSPSGKLLYEGGLTRARGHEGQNPGVELIAGILRGEAHPLERVPVFGCAFFAESGAAKPEAAP